MPPKPSIPPKPNTFSHAAAHNKEQKLLNGGSDVASSNGELSNETDKVNTSRDSSKGRPDQQQPLLLKSASPSPSSASSSSAAATAAATAAVTAAAVNDSAELSHSRTLTKGVDVAGKVSKYENFVTTRSRKNSEEEEAQQSRSSSTEMKTVATDMEEKNFPPTKVFGPQDPEAERRAEEARRRRKMLPRSKSLGNAPSGKKLSVATTATTATASLVRVSSCEVATPSQAVVVCRKATRSTSLDSKRRQFFEAPSPPPPPIPQVPPSSSSPVEAEQDNSPSPPKRPPRRNSPGLFKGRTPTPPPRSNSPSKKEAAKEVTVEQEMVEAVGVQSKKKDEIEEKKGETMEEDEKVENEQETTSENAFGASHEVRTKMDSYFIQHVIVGLEMQRRRN